MKKQFLFTATLVVATYVSMASDYQCNFSQPLDNFRVLVIESSGELSIIPNQGTAIEATSNAACHGTVKGWQFPASRPVFEFIHYVSGDTLHLVTPQGYSPAVLGFSNYTEQISSTLSVPENMTVIVKKANVVSVNGIFENLSVVAARQVSLSVISKEMVQSLTCIAQDQLVIDQQSTRGRYELHGTGKAVYQLQADKIVLTLQKP
ncbi:MAG: hypothetical protein HYZ14_07270 [Bacteroidetes bacterium]|nr:hypothetical protein [Bacteroidota bacterium]